MLRVVCLGYDIIASLLEYDFLGMIRWCCMLERRGITLWSVVRIWVGDFFCGI